MSGEATESTAGTSKQTSVEALLANVDDFIQSIYSDVGILSPPTPVTNSRVRPVRRTISPETSPMPNSNTSSLNSSSSESDLNRNIQGGSNRRLTFSPQNRHITEAEIERINRICDNVDLNLRSIGLYVNGRRGDHTSGSTTTDAFVRPTNRRNNVLSATDEIASFVDLSETQAETPEVLRPQSRRSQANHLRDADDDEVVVVSSSIPPVIDLCTPGHEEPISRPTVQRNQLSRRVLENEQEDVPVRRRRLSSTHSAVKNNKKYVAPAPEHTPSDDDNGHDTTSGHNPFICPVCMDSCLRRRPTSTKCGHVYCEQCIKQAIRLTHKCPLCNTKITDKHLIRIYL